jgi:hypothetical protein
LSSPDVSSKSSTHEYMDEQEKARERAKRVAETRLKMKKKEI